MLFSFIAWFFTLIASQWLSLIRKLEKLAKWGLLEAEIS
jgi:hypothetical protein